MKRNLILGIVAFVVLLVFVLIFSGDEELKKGEIAGNVTMLDGSSEIRRNDEILGVKVDMNVENKDEISTKSDTKMQILFLDKTLVTLGSSTEFSVKEYLHEDKNSKAEFSISKGAFKLISGNIGKISPKSFHVKTKNSSIGIRGTQFVGEVDYRGNGEDYISCLSGEVVVKSSDEEVVLIKGEMALVKENGKIEKSKTNESIFSLFEDESEKSNANLSVNDDEPTPAAHLQDLIDKKVKLSYKGKAAGRYLKTSNENKITTNLSGEIDAQNVTLELDLAKQEAVLTMGNAKRKIMKMVMDVDDLANLKSEEIEDSVDLGQMKFQNAIISPKPVIFGHIMFENKDKINENDELGLMGSFLGNNAKAFAGTLIKNTQIDDENGESYTVVLALEKE